MVSFLNLLALAPAAVSAASIGGPLAHLARQSDADCRCYPGDACWPTAADWDAFNQTVGGRLIATVPIGAPCHDSSFGSYNEAECTALQNAWGSPETHIKTSSSVMAAFFANQSCDPFLDRSDRCIIGTYVQYAVNATGADDYVNTIKFAQDNNIRFVIRNTGHDYLGKSTGAGALALWTHHIKDIEVLDYKSASYTGKALKVGAGVQVGEAQSVAHANGLVVVGGNSPTVGIAGGYTQGGGHGPLVSKYGLSADQVLEWEVITTAGQRIVATPTNNTDLYWAMSGGGGGVYAAALSVTLKVYPDTITSSANLTFTNSGISDDVFYGAIKSYLKVLPDIVDAGAVSIWLLGGGAFLMQPTTLPNKTKDELQTLLQPFLNALDEACIEYNYNIEQYDTFLDSYNAMNPEPAVTEYNIGGRLMPRTLVADDASLANLTDALSSIADNGGLISGLTINVSRPDDAVPNAVTPAWRSALFSAVVGTSYSREKFSTLVIGQNEVTDVLLPKLKALTPGGGAYLNEADRNEADYEDVFYGGNYAKLKSIKQKYDPTSTLYALTGVGSDDWEVRSDGRLCKVA
ncbi:FAD binding domain-containing protein [Colletotrichum graminicola M1.001]|uniref:FAD binding domain-containing protein n=1 Tax=Colletotrichum graminicola (strain M1.001 / M2 / FGSC 10212) TaxID=645133 RepID=E3QY99_COLGM|nr:FAD binding domain-containing protein [Colletotrichum graminicola M1.001]EFQ35837.1 FAD binding domain-containing protein [Colletotrichum graminicola M1.001]